MSAIDVLAQALHDSAVPNVPWDKRDEVVKDSWRLQAEVIAGRMIEAEGSTTPAAADGRAFNEQVDDLAEAADALNAAAVTMGTYDPVELIRTLATLRYAIRELQTIDAGLVRDIYLRAEHGDLDVPGLGRVSVKRSRDRTKWEAREAVFAYVDAQMTAREGELPDPTDIADWVMDVLPATASTECKVTALRKVGLDPKAFCEDLPGKPQVVLPTT